MDRGLSAAMQDVLRLSLFPTGGTMTTQQFQQLMARFIPAKSRTKSQDRVGKSSKAALLAACCLVESLEARELFAFSASVNFQPGASPVPTSYLKDSGAAYADRGNGFTYGWNANNSANTRDRNVLADQRFDTLIQMQQKNAYTWEMAVPNGTYQVYTVAGDPSYWDSVYKINVEGQQAVNGTPTSANRFMSGMVTVPVTDGRLTISNATGSSNNKIDFVQITQVDPGTPTPVFMSDLPMVSSTNGWGPVEKNTSVGEQAAGDGHTITLNGVSYAKGLGAHAESHVVYNLAGKYATFLSDVGVDDEVGTNGSVVFQVVADGTKIYDSGTMTGSTATKSLNLNVAGVQQLELVVTGAGDGIGCDHADWADARLIPATAPVATVPAAPSGLTATAASSSQVNLQWADNSSNETGFKVERSTDGTTFSQVATVAANATTYADNSLTGGTAYTYRVLAYNGAGNSSPSNTASVTTPAAVTADLALNHPTTASSLENSSYPASNATDGNSSTRWSSAFSDPQWIQVDLGATYAVNRVVLNWEAASGKSFDVQVSSDGNNWTSIYSTTSGPGGKQDLTGLSGIGRYVRMYGTQRNTQWGYSLYDFNVYGTATTLSVPAAPSNLSATAASSSSINLKWTDNSTNESSFTVQRSTDGTNFTSVGTAAAGATTYSDSGLAAATAYTYRVTATNAAGSSAWSNTASATTAASSQIVYSGPITITQGGTYTGNWQSLDPNVPAVKIATSSPVVIQNSNISSKGDLINASVSNVHLTVQNTNGYGLNPNVYGLHAGRFASLQSFSNVVFKNDYMEGTSGIYLLNYSGNPSLGETVKITGNYAKDIDGRKSDGNGGYLDFNSRTRLSDGSTEDGYYRVQFVQFDKVQNVPGAEIAWNQVINEPGKSRVEDVINIYASSGTASSPIQIHDNYIDGAYTIKPWQSSYSDATYKYDWGFSGGGILLSDNGSSYVNAFSNEVVSTTNYGIGISSGHDNQIYNNRVLSSGYLSTGQYITAQNIGVYIWNSSGSTNFTNDSGHDNLIGWVRGSGRNDWWTPDASSWTNTTYYSDPITTTTEANELTYWQQKLSSAGRTVGPTGN